jgi:DedD protein
MEKEKKKLLLVAISVGVFLVIVVGASLLMVSGNNSAPKGQSSAPVISSGIDPWASRVPEPVKPPETTPAETKPDSESQLLVSEDDVKQSEDLTITVPAPRAAAVPDAPKVQRPAAAPTPVQAKPVPKQEAPKTVQPRPAPTPVAAARPATPRTDIKSFNDYWIQTGAFTTQIRAEGAKESLADKGITSVIDNSNVNGRTWYRVRVGPYISENEANYLLALVKSIDGFSDSQVRLTRSVR